MNTIREALELLQQDTPTGDDIPARVEDLNIAVFDVQERINELHADAGLIEEAATIEANEESNADKRKAKRLELLRGDDEYARLEAEARASERVKLQLAERAHRLAREYRAHLLNREINYLGRRAA